MRGWSLLVRTKDGVTEHPISGAARVGRGRQCEVRIRDTSCSREHFAVHEVPEGLVLEHGHPPDQNPDGSWVTTHTYVNGVQIPVSTPLAAGDVITLVPLPDPAVVVEVRGPIAAG